MWEVVESSGYRLSSAKCYEGVGSPISVFRSRQLPSADGPPTPPLLTLKPTLYSQKGTEGPPIPCINAPGETTDTYGPMLLLLSVPHGPAMENYGETRGELCSGVVTTAGLSPNFPVRLRIETPLVHHMDHISSLIRQLRFAWADFISSGSNPHSVWSRELGLLSHTFVNQRCPSGG